MRRSVIGGYSALTAAALVLAPVAIARADPAGLTRITTDPFSNSSSQHATAVEPDTFAFGSTLVVVSQTGRFFDGGASGIGYATTVDGGVNWTQGELPNITSQQLVSSRFERVSDPSVAYDAAHDVWLVSSLPITAGLASRRVYVSRSTDGGVTFGDPITVARGRPGQDFDKNWTACDTDPASPFYGHCYTLFDDFGRGGTLKASTSTDGGLTWGPVRNTADRASGFGVQPVVQPSGNVIVPAIDARAARIIAYGSTDGGTTWTAPAKVASLIQHRPAAHLRFGGLPTAEVDAGGKVYVAWPDCRFRPGCRGNDIVMSTSRDGALWRSPERVPIGPRLRGDHFIPGIGVKPSTRGAHARIGLTSYSYGKAACGSSCALKVRYVQSNDGGATWSAPTTLAGPFSPTLIANTNQGRMVGDYISTSWLGSKAFGAFAVGQPPTNGDSFDEAIFVPAGGLNLTGSFTESIPGERVVTGRDSPHHARPRWRVWR